MYVFACTNVRYVHIYMNICVYKYISDQLIRLSYCCQAVNKINIKEHVHYSL